MCIHTQASVCFADDYKYHKEHASAVFSHLWNKRISLFMSASIIQLRTFFKKLQHEEWTVIYFEIYRWTLKSVIVIVYIHSCLIGNKGSILMHADKNRKTAVKNVRCKLADNESVHLKQESMQRTGLCCVGLHPLVRSSIAEACSLHEMVCSFRATAEDMRQ